MNEKNTSTNTKANPIKKNYKKWGKKCMKYTKQLFMILLIVFLLVGLGTIVATDINKTDVHKSTEASKTSTTSKEATNINKVSTTKENSINEETTKIIDKKTR